MPVVNVYLYFNGNCEEAFLFYQSVFGGEFSYISKYMPENKKTATDTDEKIMHIGLPISKETLLMGRDWIRSDTQENNEINFSLSLSVKNKEEADDIFSKLSEGGTVEQPMADMFWGDYFGQFKDKFGVNWLIMCSNKKD